MTTRTDRYTKAIREYVSEVYPADTDTARTIATATYDLHYGPTGAYEPDGGGYSFIDAHWVPLYLHRHAGDYVPTEKGLRRLVKA